MKKFGFPDTSQKFANVVLLCLSMGGVSRRSPRIWRSGIHGKKERNIRDGQELCVVSQEEFWQAFCFG